MYVHPRSVCGDCGGGLCGLPQVCNGCKQEVVSQRQQIAHTGRLESSFSSLENKRWHAYWDTI